MTTASKSAYLTLAVFLVPFVGPAIVVAVLTAARAWKSRSERRRLAEMVENARMR